MRFVSSRAAMVSLKYRQNEFRFIAEELPSFMYSFYCIARTMVSIFVAEELPSF